MINPDVETLLTSLLRDPLWQFVGVIVASVALALTIWRSLQPSHRLAYEYRVDSLTTVAPTIASDIQVLFRGQPVANVQIALIRVVNVGRLPIRTADFEQPLVVSLGTNAHILGTEVIKTRPTNMRPEMRSVEGSSGIEVSPLLLNQGDFFTLKVLLSGGDALPTIDSRIAGIESVHLLSPLRESVIAKLAKIAVFGPLMVAVALWSRFEVVVVGFGLILYSLVALIAAAFFAVWVDKRVDTSRLR